MQRRGRRGAHQGLCFVRSFYVWRQGRHPLDLRVKEQTTQGECVIKEQTVGTLAQSLHFCRNQGGRSGAQMAAEVVKHENSHKLKDYEGSGEEGQEDLRDRGQTKQAPLHFEILISSYACFTTTLVLE